MFEAMNEFGVDTLKAARVVVIVGLIVSLDRLL